MGVFEDLDPIFAPRGVAVVGASTRQQGPGNFVGSLLDQGFPHVYPVNPKAAEIAGLRTYPTLLDIPGPVDHVISSVPAPVVPELLDQAARKGVRSIHFFTAGFAETGIPERLALQHQILAQARALGLRLIGPNCMGLYVPGHRLAFGNDMPRESGPVGFLSQSGTNANEMIYNGGFRGLRFSKAVSFGNAIDVDAAELCRYFLDDPATAMVAAYIEGLADARPLFAALRALAARKPVALLKGGRTEAGGRATRSHTASLAGSGELWRAAMDQANVVLVDNMIELEDALLGWRFGGVPAGPRVGVIAGGGGTAVQSADDVARAGLHLPPLSQAAQDALSEFTPIAGTSVRNPVDAMSWGDDDKMRRMIEIVGAEPHIDALIVQTGMGWNPHMLAGNEGGRNQKLIDMFTAGRAALRGKPLVLSIPLFRDPRGAATQADLVQRAQAAGLAVYDGVGEAARTLARLLLWRERGGVLPALPA